MNIKIIVASIAGGIVLFVLGSVMYGLFLDGFMQASMVQYEGLVLNPPNFVPLGLYNLVLAWFITFVFDYWAEIRTAAGGAVGGGLIMFANALWTDLSFLAFMNVYNNLWFVAADIAVVTFMGVVAGSVIGLILGKMTKRESSV
ncbi:MAG: hypothetical protein HKN33_03560 [Pyrinomonadaceae bacterium]|nr:hypothetical protein [Pyrinomonadaceae bacterium]